MKVGFVGIGAMGHPMANRLREVGLLASAYDIDPARARSLGRADVAAPDLAILARASDVVITMLPSERALQDVVLGPDGLVALGLAGRTLLDMGTTSPALSRRLAEAVRSAGGSFVEAPVSGGTEAARQGTLTIIAAGDDEAYLRVRPALEVLGEKVFFVGPAGAGQTLKIANNLLFAVNVAALGEAWSLVRSAGIAAELAFNVLVACSGDSRALRTRIPEAGLVPSAPPSRDFLPGFRTRLALKDLSLATDLATALGLWAPMLEAVHRLYSAAVERGLGDLDVSVIGRRSASSIDRGARSLTGTDRGGASHA